MALHRSRRLVLKEYDCAERFAVMAAEGAGRPLGNCLPSPRRARRDGRRGSSARGCSSPCSKLLSADSLTWP